MGWGVAGALALAFALVWFVYIKFIMRTHINKLVKKAIVDGHLGDLTARAVDKEVRDRVYYSYADLKNGRVKITVEDRTDSIKPLQGENNGLNT